MRPAFGHHTQHKLPHGENKFGQSHVTKKRPGFPETLKVISISAFLRTFMEMMRPKQVLSGFCM